MRSTTSTKSKVLIAAGVLVATGAVAAGAVYADWVQVVPIAGMAINYVRSWSLPPGTVSTELASIPFS